MFIGPYHAINCLRAYADSEAPGQLIREFFSLEISKKKVKEILYRAYLIIRCKSHSLFRKAELSSHDAVNFFHLQNRLQYIEYVDSLLTT